MNRGPLDLAQALGHVKAAYLALSGARNLIKHPKLVERTKDACRVANDLECDILKIFATRELPVIRDEG